MHIGDHPHRARQGRECQQPARPSDGDAQRDRESDERDQLDPGEQDEGKERRLHAEAVLDTFVTAARTPVARSVSARRRTATV